MGTNYQFIDRRLGRKYGPLHIGRSTVGWEFCWHGYRADDLSMGRRIIIGGVLDTVDKWMEYLQRAGRYGKVANGCGDFLAVGKFLDLVEAKRGGLTCTDSHTGDILFQEFC